jgi:hypothetical protein
MEFWDRYLFLRHIAAALAQGVSVALVLPLISLLLFKEPLMPTLALIGSGLVIEYGAAPVGIALGLSPFFVFWVLMCTETGIFIGLFAIFDAVGHTWPPAADFLVRTKQFIHQYSLAERYGILGLVPCEILIGVYANAPVSWVLGWHKEQSLAFTMAGYVPCLVMSILATEGLLALSFPGVVHP